MGTLLVVCAAYTLVGLLSALLHDPPFPRPQRREPPKAWVDRVRAWYAGLGWFFGAHVVVAVLSIPLALLGSLFGSLASLA